jgi:hypothetical protein
MNKKGLRVSTLVGCLTLAIPCFAGASALDSSLVGDVAALANFCGGLEPEGREGAEKFLRELKQEFGAATSSAEYRDAYEKMRAALIKLNRQTAYALCSVTPRRTGKPHDHDPPDR